MHLTRIQFRSFRNYSQLELGLAPGLVVFHGPNAQGKTNLLEGILLACTGRMLRFGDESDLIGWEQPLAQVRADLATRERGYLQLEASLPRESSLRIKINQVARRAADLIGLASVVVFSAEDLAVVKGDPSVRRRFLNQELSSASRSYHWNLLRFGRALEQRNRLLREIKDGQASPEELTGWDEQVARLGGRLMEKREQFLSEIDRFLPEAYRKICREEGRLRMSYRPALAEGEGDFESRLLSSLQSRRQEEVARAVTLSGPQRDDIEITLAQVPLRTFGSQGEQRSAAVALRLALLRWLEEKVGESPLLLLDDVFSELDPSRRSALLEELSGVEQALVTCTDRDDLPSGAAAGSLFRVTGGRVEAEP